VERSEGAKETESREPSLRLIVNNQRDIIREYLTYASETESPTVFHRWCFLTSIGALLGRNVYLRHGHFRIFPNFYTMLVGDPGTRKSVAIKMCQRLMAATGYTSFGANKTSKEKFLMDLEGIVDDPELSEAGKKGRIDFTTEQNLWGDNSEFREPREVFICADEFNQFAGTNNIDFYDILGDLWDWDNNLPYKQRVKNSHSVSIFQPTVSILGGNTHENMSRAFPPELVGQGFMSRLLLVHGGKPTKKIAFPPPPLEEETQKIVERLGEVKRRFDGEEIEIDKDARGILTEMYESWIPLTDPRLSNYNTRRFTHLLKLCLITAAATHKQKVDEEVVIYSNTMLSAVEMNMSLALGEFGKARNSDVSHKIMNVLYNARAPVSIRTMWEYVHSDLDKIGNLQELMQGLAAADKVQLVLGANGGYLAKKAVTAPVEWCDFTMLTESERIGVVE